MTKRIVLYLLLAATVTTSAIRTCLAQVPLNNNIDFRIKLELDSPALRSTTRYSDVQWSCINKKLTQKCLIYHNDQWFSVCPSTHGPFFLNVSNQHCRDRQGVQMVIIEGDPCKTEGYTLMKCIPFTDQSDFFVMLDSLNPGQEYLINIDGFLGDLCEFDISFSTHPQGVPVMSPFVEGIDMESFRKDSIVHLSWTVPDSLLSGVRGFLVARKKEDDKRTSLLSKPMVYNAYGSPRKDYSLTDTLREKGAYTYSIFLENDRGVFGFAHERIEFKDEIIGPVIRSNKRQIEFYLREDGSVLINVLSEARDNLYSFRQQASKGRNAVTLVFSSLVAQGHSKIIITLKNKNINEEQFFPSNKNTPLLCSSPTTQPSHLSTHILI